jgi:hypothetical protein
MSLADWYTSDLPPRLRRIARFCGLAAPCALPMQALS